MGAKCLVKCTKERDLFKFGLTHKNPELFTQSQWDLKGRTSVWYMLYRVFVAQFFVIGLICDWVFGATNKKWLIYMTDQGILLLTIHYVIDAGMVLKRFLWEKKNRAMTYNPSGEMGFFAKFAWMYHSLTNDAAIFISIVFWSALYEGNTFEHGYQWFLNFFVHGLNSIFVVIDVFIIAKPIRVPHGVFAAGYGFVYLMFSVIYWAAGGLGECYPCPMGDCSLMDPTCEDTEECTPATVDGIPGFCLTYIYTITDWGGHPGVATLTVCLGMVGIFIIHAFIFGLTLLRQKIFSNMIEKKGGKARHGVATWPDARASAIVANIEI